MENQKIYNAVIQNLPVHGEATFNKQGGLSWLKKIIAGRKCPTEGKKEHLAKQLSVFLFILFSCLFTLYLIDLKLFNLESLIMRIDLFAFGGGFASLPLMLHEIVEVRGWMDSKTFMDGIALGQVTLGPIVIMSTFVGYMISGAVGALVATVAVFSPSFLMVIAVTPVMDKLRTAAYFTKATKGILASFAGLLFFVTVTFSFAVPWDMIKGLLVRAAFFALSKKVDILYVVLVTSAISLFLF